MSCKKTFLADFHVHTNFSDGKIPLSEVIDLYGRSGFGAIAITDHVAEQKSLVGKLAVLLKQVLSEKFFPEYLRLLKSEAERAWDKYKMVVIPGFELSKNSINNHRSAHILGLGISQFLPADGDATELIDKIHAQGALAVAAHPVYSRVFEKQTYHLWDRRKELENKFDAWEVASGRVLFDEVKDSKLPKLASSDLHVAKQLTSWKTKLHCEKRVDAILDEIKHQRLDFSYFDAPAAVTHSK